MWPFSRSSTRDDQRVQTLQLNELKKANASWKTLVPITLALGSLIVGLASLLVTLGLREDVQNIGTSEPQEVVDQLVIGRTEAQVEALLGFPTYAYQMETPWSDLPEVSYRMYELFEGDLIVEALYDDLNEARLFEVTAISEELVLRHPPSAQGGLARFPVEGERQFWTHLTTLDEMESACGFQYSALIGASWASGSGHCPPMGATNFATGIAGISLFADGDHGLGVVNGTSGPPYDGTITFSTFVYLDNRLFLDVLPKEDDPSTATIFDWLEVGPNKLDPPSRP